jgi:hypothetical protein
MTVDVDTPVDQDALFELIGRFVGDLGATMAAGNIVIGAEPRITEAFRTGAASAGMSTTQTCSPARRRSSANLVSNWIPALDGVDAKLTAGGRVADVGCGLAPPPSC